MSEYHRLFIKGGTFFTVVTYNRQHLLCEESALIRLKAAFRYVMNKRPYRMDGLVILPDPILKRQSNRWARRWCSFAHPTFEWCSAFTRASISSRRINEIIFVFWTVLMFPVILNSFLYMFIRNAENVILDG